MVLPIKSQDGNRDLAVNHARPKDFIKRAIKHKLHHGLVHQLVATHTRPHLACCGWDLADVCRVERPPCCAHSCRISSTRASASIPVTPPTGGAISPTSLPRGALEGGAGDLRRGADCSLDLECEGGGGGVDLPPCSAASTLLGWRRRLAISAACFCLHHHTKL